MVTDHDLAQLDKTVGKYFQIEEITYGGAKQPFVVRYRGSLKNNDSQSTFDLIANALIDQKLVPMMRREEGIINLYLLPDVKKEENAESAYEPDPLPPDAIKRPFYRRFVWV